MAKPIGTISHRQNGDYKKVGEGKWVKVTEPKESKEGEVSGRFNLTGNKDYDKLTSKTLENVNEQSLSSLKSYTFDSMEQNSFLRDPKEMIEEFELDDEEISYLKKEIQNIDKAFKDAPDITQELPTLFRGSQMSNSMLRSLSEGSQFLDKSFVSTSSNPDIAKTFMSERVFGNQVPVLIKISNVDKGNKVLPISALSSIEEGKKEEEFLLERDSYFSVLTKRKNKGGLWEIEVSVE